MRCRCITQYCGVNSMLSATAWNDSDCVSVPTRSAFVTATPVRCGVYFVVPPGLPGGAGAGALASVGAGVAPLSPLAALGGLIRSSVGSAIIVTNLSQFDLDTGSTSFLHSERRRSSSATSLRTWNSSTPFIRWPISQMRVPCVVVETLSPMRFLAIAMSAR